MKTAVSIPDAVFEAAERLAERQQCSRSRLYTQALEYLLAALDSEKVTDRLNAVHESQPSEIDPLFRAAQQRVLDDEQW